MAEVLPKSSSCSPSCNLYFPKACLSEYNSVKVSLCSRLNYFSLTDTSRKTIKGLFKIIRDFFDFHIWCPSSYRFAQDCKVFAKAGMIFGVCLGGGETGPLAAQAELITTIPAELCMNNSTFYDKREVWHLKRKSK